LLKGTPTLSRYRLLDAPQELTDEYIQDRLKHHSFVDIEATAEEASLGWVEILNTQASDFEPASFRFGSFIAFVARLDHRRLAAKTLNRYYQIREAEFVAQAGRKPNAQKKKELKEALRQELLRRSLLDTELLEVLWFPQEMEIWLGGAGEKKRALFEDLWERTFGLGARLLVPITLGLETLTKAEAEALLQIESSSLWAE
ncbi:MAG: recombination-associated protein RdgC, partial [Deltaproteobacteria bacterium]|nr:recombination-associated protein RdgC [Deltaproteobacteria bacterium]